jgi:hypothetical protein
MGSICIAPCCTRGRFPRLPTGRNCAARAGDAGEAADNFGYPVGGLRARPGDAASSSWPPSAASFSGTPATHPFSAKYIKATELNDVREAVGANSGRGGREGDNDQARTIAPGARGRSATLDHPPVRHRHGRRRGDLRRHEGEEDRPTRRLNSLVSRPAQFLSGAERPPRALRRRLYRRVAGAERLLASLGLGQDFTSWDLGCLGQVAGPFSAHRHLRFERALSHATLTRRGVRSPPIGDPEAFPASELVALYHERWELELGYDKIRPKCWSPRRPFAARPWLVSSRNSGGSSSRTISSDWRSSARPTNSASSQCARAAHLQGVVVNFKSIPRRHPEESLASSVQGRQTAAGGPCLTYWHWI